MTFATGLFIGAMVGAGLAFIGLAAVTSGTRSDSWARGWNEGYRECKKDIRELDERPGERNEPTHEMFARH